MIPDNYKGPKTFLQGFWPGRVLLLVWLGLLFLGCLWEVKADGLTPDQLNQLKIEFQTLKKQTQELKATLAELSTQNESLTTQLAQAKTLLNSQALQLNELNNNWNLSKLQNQELRSFLTVKLNEAEDQKWLFGAGGAGIGAIIVLTLHITGVIK